MQFVVTLPIADHLCSVDVSVVNHYLLCDERYTMFQFVRIRNWTFISLLVATMFVSCLCYFAFVFCRVYYCHCGVICKGVIAARHAKECFMRANRIVTADLDLDEHVSYWVWGCSNVRRT